MDISLALDKIKAIRFHLDVGEYGLDKTDKQFKRADILDLYSNDVEFVTIDYFSEDGSKKETKIIRKTNIDHIDILYDS
jgi:hypothetical protein